MLLELRRSGVAALCGVTVVLAQRSQAALSNDKLNKIDNKWVEVKRCMPQDRPTTVSTCVDGSASDASRPICESVLSESECDGNRTDGPDCW